MTHRHSRRKLVLQPQRYAVPERAPEERHDSALIERVSRDELREIVRQQRLHFMLLERAMRHLSSELPDEGAGQRPHDPAQGLPGAAAPPALQHDLEAILLAELCDEPELDPSGDPPDPSRKAN